MVRAMSVQEKRQRTVLERGPSPSSTYEYIGGWGVLNLEILSSRGGVRTRCLVGSCIVGIRCKGRCHHFLCSLHGCRTLFCSLAATRFSFSLPPPCEILSRFSWPYRYRCIYVHLHVYIYIFKLLCVCVVVLYELCSLPSTFATSIVANR